MSKIAEIKAREIIDSRGNPTIEVDVILTNNILARASVPSGASTGSAEAVELRDNDENRYNGKGVLVAIDSVKSLAKLIIGKEISEYKSFDQLFLHADNTKNKSKFGANAILALSLACAKAAAQEKGLFLYEFLGNKKEFIMPLPLMNIINGGAHANNGLDIQEFMIAPLGASSFKEAVRFGAEIFHALKHILQERLLSTSVGDEGGFAPDISEPREALDLILAAIKKAGYIPGTDVKIALDIAATELYEGGKYHFKGIKKVFTTSELVDFYEDLVANYPIFSIEDPIAENDYEGWKLITARLGKNIQLVGDDVFVTNVEYLQKGIDDNFANSILIKPNQIGTLSETEAAIKLAHSNDYSTIMSHRSGETADVSIAHLAVAYGCKQIKAGSLSRSDRVEKYNELIRIEELLNNNVKYAGKLLFS
jgi:enolase